MDLEYRPIPTFSLALPTMFLLPFPALSSVLGTDSAALGPWGTHGHDKGGTQPTSAQTAQIILPEVCQLPPLDSRRL